LARAKGAKKKNNQPEKLHLQEKHEEMLILRKKNKEDGRVKDQKERAVRQKREGKREM